MKRCLMLALVMGSLPLIGWGQDSARTLLSAARKRALDARVEEGAGKTAVYEDCVRLLRLIPERYPEEGPAVARAWLELGRTYRRLDRLPDAQQALQTASRMDGEPRVSTAALHDLASLHRRAGRRPEAAAALRAVVDGYPGQARSRARALIRLAGLERQGKRVEGARGLLRQCLKEHGDLWRQSVDALDALVALELAAKDLASARRCLDAHTAALRARFSATDDEDSLERALARMGARARLAKAEAGSDGDQSPR